LSHRADSLHGMSQAAADGGEFDEDTGSAIPEPPRRVPFGVVVTTVLLGLLSVPLILVATVTLFSGESFTVTVGEATLRGLAASAVAVCAVLVVAVAWSFVRDGNTAGPMVVGLLVVVTGLFLLAAGVVGDDPDTRWLRLGVPALVLGLGVLLTPLLGHGPAYLAARRVWSRAERDWLHELTTPASPQAYPQPQWPGHYPPPQQQWGGAPQPHYPPHYQYPSQQAWPEAAAPPWQGQHPPTQPFSAPPAQPLSAPPAQAFPVPPTQSFAPPPAQTESAPAQPTEQIRPADPVP